MRNNPYPVRVLHVFGGMNRGGAETLIMNIYRNIDRNKVQFDFAVNTHNECDFDREIISMGGRIFCHGSPRIVGIHRHAKAFSATLNHKGPFVAVHSHVYSFSGIYVREALKSRIAVRIAHSHNTSDGRKSSIQRIIYRIVMRYLIHKHSTHLFGCSTIAAESLFGQKPFEDRRFKLIPNAIDFKNFKDISGQEKNNIRNSLSLPEDAIVIGHVGRFSEQKNHDYLLDIFSRFWSEFPSAHLLLVGDGPLRACMEKRTRSSGFGANVHFLGLRADVPELMSAMDLFLFPSLHEGLPVVLVEAQAAGLPCVISSAITREVDVDLGLIEYIDLAENEQVWVDAISRNIATTIPSIETRALALMSSGFDLEHVVKILENVYCE